MPAIADIALLLRFLAHLGDHRVAGCRGKEPIDVDVAKATGEGDMLLRGQMLIAEKDDTVFAKYTADLGQFEIARRRCQIHSRYLSADIGSERRNLDMVG